MKPGRGMRAKMAKVATQMGNQGQATEEPG